MQPSAKVLLDSVSPQGVRLISFEVWAHRWILAEINTHRVLSRNYRSSRAVPVKKTVEEVRKNPAMPVVWMKNKPGMVATEPMTPEEAAEAKARWLAAAASAADHAEALAATGLHKQWVNRGLEDYLFVPGVISGTDWNNFFALRRAEDAQPEFKALADAMWWAMQGSKPKLLMPGEWHLPYVTNQDKDAIYWAAVDAPEHELPQARQRTAIKLSVARVARVSIKPFDSDRADVFKDLELHDRLLKQRHMSPFEHQATPDTQVYNQIWGDTKWCHPDQHGNFRGWRQHRKMIPGECIPG